MSDEGIVVLSCFDGMSCGQLALDRAGINVKKYFASEIDKYAIQVSTHNYPEMVHLGDIQTLDIEKLPKIDLLIGGSPCQGFSFAGAQLNFDDPRSKLFFDFAKIYKKLKEKNPSLMFLLENVRMKQAYQDVISEYMGCKPIMINSKLLSAQNRVRLYWTNIPSVTQPEDLGLVLRDIIDYSDDNVLSETAMAYMMRNSEKWSEGKVRLDNYGKKEDEKAGCLTANMYKGVPYGVIGIEPSETKGIGCIQVGMAKNIRGLDVVRRIYSPDGKSPALTSMTGGHRHPKISLTGIDPTKTNQINPSKKAGGKQPHMQDRVFHEDGKIHAMTASFAAQSNIALTQNDELRWRRLSPLECERLQTVPDNYTLLLDDDKQLVSNSQRYKMLGNGWTIDVIAHIFRSMRPTNRIACALEDIAKHLEKIILLDKIDHFMEEIDIYHEEIMKQLGEAK